MEKEQIKEKVKNILISVLKHDNFEMDDELTAAWVDGWDSLNHIIIITEIERCFDIKFKLKDLNKLNKMGNLLELVSSKIEQKLI